MSTLQAKAQNAPTIASDHTAQLIRRVRQATRKRYTAEEKIRIVMEGIRGDDPISTICRREGIQANRYYKWLKSFMDAGKERLKGEGKRGATHGEVEELKRDIEGLKLLVAELNVDNMVLKKGCSDSATQRVKHQRSALSQCPEFMKLVRKSPLSIQHRLASLGVARATYYSWCRPSCSLVSRRSWNGLREEEVQTVLAYAQT